MGGFWYAVGEILEVFGTIGIIACGFVALGFKLLTRELEVLLDGRPKMRKIALPAAIFIVILVIGVVMVVSQKQSYTKTPNLREETLATALLSLEKAGFEDITVVGKNRVRIEVSGREGRGFIDSIKKSEFKVIGQSPVKGTIVFKNSAIEVYLDKNIILTQNEPLQDLEATPVIAPTAEQPNEQQTPAPNPTSEPASAPKTDEQSATEPASASEPKPTDEPVTAPPVSAPPETQPATTPKPTTAKPKTEPDVSLNGKHKVTVDNGTYDGEFVNGKKSGYGIYTWNTGDSYDGHWENDKKSGEGSYHWANGNIYYGSWKNDAMHGKGVYCFTDGSYYEAYWINGKKGGEVIYYNADGSFNYSEEWENGVKKN